MADWGSVVREHGPMAFQTAWRILGDVHDTEDIVQESLLEALRAWRKGEVRNWGGLLRQAATCRALDRLRRRQKPGTLDVDPAAPESERPDCRAEANELAEWLRRALAELPGRQAQVFSMRYFSEMTNPEIAAELGISVEAVAVAVHKARRQLAEKRDDLSSVARRPAE